MSVVSPAWPGVLRTKTFWNCEVLPGGTRLLAKEVKATVPLLATEGAKLNRFPWAPVSARLARITPVAALHTNTSAELLTSPATRLVALDSKATHRPLGLMAGVSLSPLASPPGAALMRVRVMAGGDTAASR